MTKSSFDRAKIFADECAQIYLNALSQYSAVARKAADDIGDGKFGAEQWVKTATQLLDIAAVNGLQFAETVFAGPGAPFAPAYVRSEDVRLTEDVDCLRILSIDEDLHLEGTGGHVDRRRVRFVPRGEPDEEGFPTGRLSAGTSTFHLVMPTAGRTGGTYVGTVRVHPQDTGRKDQVVPVQVVW